MSPQGKIITSSFSSYSHVQMQQDSFDSRCTSPSSRRHRRTSSFYPFNPLAPPLLSHLHALPPTDRPTRLPAVAPGEAGRCSSCRPHLAPLPQRPPRPCRLQRFHGMRPKNSAMRSRSPARHREGANCRRRRSECCCSCGDLAPERLWSDADR